MRSAILLISWVLLLLLAGCKNRAAEGQVVGVLDGDTIEVMVDGEAKRIRLYGIDAPEKKQAYGPQAKQDLSGIVFGRTVSFVSKGTDRYGRTIAQIYLGESYVNAELVSRGAAWWYREYAPHDNQLAEAEQEARNAFRGLWGSPNPTPPWEWRRKAR